MQHRLHPIVQHVLDQGQILRVAITFPESKCAQNWIDPNKRKPRAMINLTNNYILWSGNYMSIFGVIKPQKEISSCPFRAEPEIIDGHDGTNFLNCEPGACQWHDRESAISLI